MKNSTFVSNATGADKILLHKFSTHALKRGSIIMTNWQMFLSLLLSLSLNMSSCWLCLLIALTTCRKGHESLGQLCSAPKNLKPKPHLVVRLLLELPLEKWRRYKQQNMKTKIFILLCEEARQHEEIGRRWFISSSHSIVAERWWWR